MTINEFIWKVDLLRFYQEEAKEKGTEHLKRRVSQLEREVDKMLDILRKKSNELEDVPLWYEEFLDKEVM